MGIPAISDLINGFGVFLVGLGLGTLSRFILAPLFSGIVIIGIVVYFFLPSLIPYWCFNLLGFQVVCI